MPSKTPQKPWLIPAVIILFALLCSTAMTIFSQKPESTEKASKAMLVNALLIKKEDLTVMIPSQGRVTPHTQTTLISEVSGSVIEVSTHFVSGGFVKKGQLLLKLDDRNYLAALKKAEANLAKAHTLLIKEKGQAQVAYRQWKQSKNKTRTAESKSLLLHKPQLKEAEANLAFAEAELERAKGDLAKTEIHAPYDGLIKEKLIDFGQYATPGSNFAQMIATDYAEVRLAIPQDRLGYLKLPLHSMINAQSTNHQLKETTGDYHHQDIPVTLTSRYGDIAHQWQAQLVRTEGMFDEKSHALYVIAQVKDPYGFQTTSNTFPGTSPPLLMGTFVKASIQGQQIKNITTIPRHVLRAGNHVWIIDSENKLRNRQVSLLNIGGEQAYISAGLDDGEYICLTNIGEVVPGTVVQISDAKKQLSSTNTAL